MESAIKNINDNESKLTGNQAKVLGNINTIDVNSSAKRSFVIENKGAFTLTPRYVDSASKQFLGSAIGHDAFHVEQFKLGGIASSRSVQAEKDAFVFQFAFGQKIGIASYEADYLKDLINDPKKLEPYYNSPIK